MQIHNVRSQVNKKKKRVARGGKRGTTAGRGTKGQKSRAGRNIRPAERDLIIRIPKKRGFSNNPKSPDAKIFNLSAIDEAFKGQAPHAPVSVTPETMKEINLLSPRFSGEVKILGDGEISYAIDVQNISTSKSAKEKIVKAGGKA